MRNGIIVGVIRIRCCILYKGADGVKTGYTKLSNRTLVSSATRAGQQLAAVTLNDGSDWMDHSKLLDFGFEHYPQQVIQASGEPLKGTSFVSPNTFTYPLAEDEEIHVEVKFIQEETLIWKTRSESDGLLPHRR